MTPDQNVNRPNDWVGETHESITARLEAAKVSQAQTRFTLGTMALISMMMLIASYNAYLSYDYNWIIKEPQRRIEAKKIPDILTEEQKEKKAETEKISGILRDQALKDWASSRIVLISLLGIRVSVDDAAVLGSAVLLVLSLWLLLVTRRENHTIGSLLRHTDTPRSDSSRDPSLTPSMESQRKIYSSEERWRIFHTINSNSFFVTLDRSLSSVHSLSGPNPLKASPTSGFRGWLNKVGFGLVRGFFFWFPAIASFIVFCLDRWSYFIPDPFDPEFKLPGIEPFFWRSMVVFFLCWIPLIACCWKSSQYSRATEKVLREYKGKLAADLSQQEQAAQS
jgi:hypothetical protein